VDLAAAEIRITGSAAVVGGQRIEGTTKSGRSRTVSIDAGTVQVLREHYARQVADHETVGPEWRGGGYVFATGWGDPVHPDTVSSLVADLIRAHNSLVAGDDPDGLLPSARLHDLRHVHATTLLLAGVPVHVVAARLGHADPSVTLRVYAHVVRDHVAEAADVFARSVAAPVSKSVSKKPPAGRAEGR
jgi:integrase